MYLARLAPVMQANASPLDLKGLLDEMTANGVDARKLYDLAVSARPAEWGAPPAFPEAPKAPSMSELTGIMVERRKAKGTP